MFWWKLFQLSIMFAVGAANIRHHWTDNGLLVGIMGGVAAYLATLAVYYSACFVGYLRQRWTLTKRLN